MEFICLSESRSIYFVEVKSALGKKLWSRRDAGMHRGGNFNDFLLRPL